jgi:dihydroxy-acid dehydratase
MEDFHAAGGMGAVLDELRPLLHLECRDVTGQTLEERLQRRPVFVDRTVIRPTNEPFHGNGSLVALFGNLAPQGSILKCAAADARLFEHVGRAVVFKNLDDLSARIDDPNLDVEPDDVLVLQHAGPIAAGMPEAGYLPIPAKLARAGVKDMVRISDARMSGTAFGTVILHASPECATGGPLGLVRSGDRIRLSVKARTIDVLLTAQELESRRQAEAPPKPQPVRGYARLYAQHVLGPELGCDFDFLRQSP